MQFWRIVAVLALLLCGALIGERYWRDYLNSADEPRAITPRSDLAGEEQRTIALFAAIAPSVVAISAGRGENPLAEGAGAAGSGFVWDKAGHIVTNNHVIEGASRIIVVLDDGRQIPGRIVGTAPWNDLAVLKLENAPGDLRPIDIGASSDLQVGQTVSMPSAIRSASRAR